MPLKLNVGLTRKIGGENYGSRGASVNLELELDSSLVAEPAKLQEKIRQVFGMVRTALAEELNENGNCPKSQSTGNGKGSNSNRNGAESARNATPHPATQSQVKAIYGITKQRQLNLAEVLQNRFQVARPEDLSIKQASELIGELKASSKRTGG